MLQTIESDVYSQYADVARQRIDKRDQDDWPIVAVALEFDCPIWTEDTDFFGWWRGNLDYGARGVLSGEDCSQITH